MRYTESVSKHSFGKGRHLKLVGGLNPHTPRDQPIQATDRSPDTATVRQLTHAIMNRLWIPHTTTIVGLLDVGLSRTNFDELSKWITQQLTTAPEGGAANELPQLEQRFRRAVDRFPEF